MDTTQDLDIGGLLRGRLFRLALAMFLGAALGFGVSLVMSPVYQGTADLLVGDFSSGDVTSNDITAMQSLTATYADIGRREPVLEAAAKDLGPGTDWHTLSSTVEIYVPKESPQVIEISVQGANPEHLRRVAGAVARSLVGYVGRTESGSTDFVSAQLHRLQDSIDAGEAQLEKLQAEQRSGSASSAADLATSINRVQTQLNQSRSNYAAFRELASTSGHVSIQPLGAAYAPKTPVSPNIVFNTAVGGFVGLLLGLAVLYLLSVRRGSGPDPTVVAVTPPVVPPTLPQLVIPARGRNVRRQHNSASADQDEGEVS